MVAVHGSVNIPPVHATSCSLARERDWARLERTVQTEDRSAASGSQADPSSAAPGHI
ncbi:hypothetical protein BV25DRAFT_1820293 [Artomyces pyxidatus]|uniref:Uncharacterized protein n=1 Tax=Artomyces pyxidatus TaxID=48021 RepID=A0ACB8TFE8_9AGAM|nr:hypothetical protein BV25DRAFT_1820293 [Artomyces pyxidatus]